MRQAGKNDEMPGCPFCSRPIGVPEEITTRFGNTFSGGRCTCGAVFVVDSSGHNLGEAYVDALAYACNNDYEKAWSLQPDVDYEIRELSADARRNTFREARRGGKFTYLFILLKEQKTP